MPASRALSTSSQVIIHATPANNDQDEEEEEDDEGAPRWSNHPQSAEIATFLASMPANVTVDKPWHFLKDEKPFQYLDKVATWKTKTVDVRNFMDINGPPVGTIDLSQKVFGECVSIPLLHEVVRWQRASHRFGLKKLKTRAERAGSGRKVRPQKGSGRSRVGSVRAAHWRGGGRIFGPKGNRDYSFKVNRKAVRKANRCVLSAKLQEGKFVVVDSFAGVSGKTKDMVKLLKELGIGKGALLVDGLNIHPKCKQATGNIQWVHAVSHLGMTPHTVIKHDTLILTKAAVMLLEDRLIPTSTYWPEYMHMMPGWKEVNALSEGTSLEEEEVQAKEV